MNLRKRLIAGLLAGTMLFMTACGPKDSGNSAGNDNKENGKGSFVETNVTPENIDGISNLGRLEDGSIVAFSSDMAKKFESKDNGVSWTESEGPAVKNPELVNPETVSISPDGTVYCAAREGADYNGKLSLYKISKDGTVSLVEIKELQEAIQEKGNASIYQMLAISDEKVLLHFMGMNNDFGEGMMMNEGNEDGTVEGAENNNETNEDESEGNSSIINSSFDSKQYCGIYNTASGEKAYDIDVEMLVSANISGDKLYLTLYDGTIQVKNIEDGKSLYDIPGTTSDDMVYFSMPQIATDKNGNLFSIDKNGLVSVSEKGEKTKTVEGTSFAFSNPQNYAQSLIANDDGSFLVLMTESMSGKATLYRYHFDENAVYDESKVLKIWTLEENNIIRAAVSSFCEKNPGVQVEIEVGSNTQQGVAPADIIRNLNTEILAGKGPDLIVLDKLPSDSYIKQGILLNLNSKVDISNMYSAISDTIKDGNGDFYSAPSRFKVPVFMGTKEDIDKINTLEELVTAIKEGKDKPALGENSEDIFSALPEAERPFMSFSEFDEAFKLLWATGISKIIEGNTIDKENLGVMLTALKELSDKFKLFDEQSHGGGAISMSNGGVDNDIFTGGIMDYMTQRAKTGAALIGDVFSLTSLNSGDKNAYKIFPGISSGSWIPLSNLGVNAKSDKQELAIDFINHMISDDVQQISGAGFPVTDSGLKKQEEAYKQLLKENGIPETELPPFDMEDLVKELSAPITTNEFVEEIVLGEAELFCKGEQTIENTISNIESKTKTYLAEQG